ncbi:MAG: nucleotidyltransferase domain-containing protein [Pseudomonadota bacterium]|nr:nucleotidyltransferase domain-containing protein [Pseudomonadota bacterium]
MLKAHFESLLHDVNRACQDYYGERLTSLAVFGSVARATMRPDSDIDLLLVADPLPDGRMARVGEFEAVERAIAPALQAATKSGLYTTLSPVFKTSEELQRGSFLFLDLADQARILYDRDNVLKDYLADLTKRLNTMGAKRVYKGGGYYWVLKPDLKPGEEITL